LPATLSPAPQNRRRPRRAAATPLGLALALAAVTLAALSGCGSSHSAGTAVDPATVIPASAAIYAGADVRPAGAEKSGALAAGKALTHQADPYLRLLGALQSPGSPQLRFAQDVAPWLGPHAGIFLTSLASSGALTALLQQGLLGGAAAGGSSFPFGAGRAQGAIVLDTSDATKARGFLDGQAKRAGAHPGVYRGVSVQASPSGVAFALVHRLAVLGSEAAVHSVIDTSQGASPLAASSGYAKLLKAAPAGALAHLYSNPSGAPAGGAQAGGAGLLGLLTGPHQANVSLLATAGSLALDADTLASGSGTGSASGSGGLLANDPEAAQALGELPAESWLAIGLGHLGASLAADVGGMHALASLGASGVEAPPSASTINVKSLLAAMLAPLDALGANSAAARRDFASWMGSAGVFASGGSLLELKAAIVIASKNPAASRAAVNKLAAALRSSGGSLRQVKIPGTDAAVGVALSGLPVVLDIADGRDAAGHTKFVLGFGEASVEDALHPTGSLAQGAAPRTAAATALGEGIQPSAILDFPTVLTLLEGLSLTEDPTLARFVPYLRAASTLSGGGRDLGAEVQRFRLVIGLQHAGA
jgi:hypothetical protein